RTLDRARVAIQEQPHVRIVLTLVDVPEELRGEAGDVRRLAARLGDQPLHGDLRRLIERRRLGERRRRVFGDAPLVSIHERSVVDRLPAARLAKRPLRLPPGGPAAGAQAETARNEVLVQDGEARREGRYAQRRFDGGWAGVERDGRLHVPDERLLLRADR